MADGFSILKVGPWLTFALREALYGLDAIADVLDGQTPQHRLMTSMEATMQRAPENWAKYYHGSDVELWQQRHFSYSDRIRYYWHDPAAEAAVSNLKARLAGHNIPDPVLRQYLPVLAQADGANFEALLLKSVEAVLATYHAAIHA